MSIEMGLQDVARLRGLYRTEDNRLFPDGHMAWAVAALGAIIGAAYFLACPDKPWPPAPAGFSSSFYAGAMTVAAGRPGGLQGFVTPSPPEIQAFMNMETMTLDPSHLDSPDITRNMGDWEREHRYLLLAIGWFWRIFGISWNGLKVFLIIGLAISGVLAYFLFRLGMNRFLSFAAVLLFLSAPMILATLPSPRDFLKTPFLLGAFLLLGHLIRTAPAPRRFLTLAALLGLVLGVGIGFRRDVIVALPPTLAILAFGAGSGRGLPMPRRVAAIALFLACFLPPALPILLVNSGSSSSFHFITGLATACESNMGLSCPPYERLYLSNDNFVHATYCAYAQREWRDGLDIQLGGSAAARAGNHVVWEIIKTFPGDLVTRCYGATLRMLGGFPIHLYGHGGRLLDQPNYLLWHPLAMHLERFGFYYATAALLLVSCGRPRLAWLTLGLVLYFAGYTSLQYQLRHCVHLAVLPLLCLGVCLDYLCRASAALWGAITASGKGMSFTELRAALRSYAQRGLRFALLAAILMATPLCLARAVQWRTVGELYDKHAAADLTPLTCQESIVNDEDFRAQNVNEYGPTCLRRPWRHELGPHTWTMLAPTGLDSGGDGPGPPRDGIARQYYLVIQFESLAEPLPLWIRYAASDGSSGFWKVCWVQPSKTSTRYFFPVYESEKMRFLGVALPQERSSVFHGLYQVKNLGDFPILLNLSLPESREELARGQHLWRFYWAEQEVF